MARGMPFRLALRSIPNRIICTIQPYLRLLIIPTDEPTCARSQWRSFFHTATSPGYGPDKTRESCPYRWLHLNVTCPAGQDCPSMTGSHSDDTWRTVVFCAQLLWRIESRIRDGRVVLLGEHILDNI